MGSKAGEFFKFIFSLKFLKHFGIALAIFLLLAISSIVYLRYYTNHGEFVQVPNLAELELSQAIEVLDAMDLDYEVIDSVYAAKALPGTIIDQTPKAGEKIKAYRHIYLIINSYSKPNVSLPDVRDLSYRNAKATLEAIGFIVDNVQFVPSEFKNLVINVKSGSTILDPGSRLQRDSHVTLVVGGEPGKTEIPTPSFRGLSYAEIVLIALRDSLNIRSVTFEGDPINKADSAKYFAYKQSPIKSSPIRVGSSVNVWLTKDKESLALPEQEFVAPVDTAPKREKPVDIEEFNF